MYMTLSSQENTFFFTLFILSRTSDNTLLKILMIQIHGPPPTSNVGEDRPPVPLDFRPCSSHMCVLSRLSSTDATFQIHPRCSSNFLISVQTSFIVCL